MCCWGHLGKVVAEEVVSPAHTRFDFVNGDDEIEACFWLAAKPGSILTKRFRMLRILDVPTFYFDAINPSKCSTEELLITTSIFL